ncbi:unnamed protein product [Amoebophrya sp. A120]|nr:unnamed protein product [Amoebophrya sp. A120]|eukprot:GSA120T00021416001.1
MKPLPHLLARPKIVGKKPPSAPGGAAAKGPAAAAAGEAALTPRSGGHLRGHKHHPPVDHHTTNSVPGTPRSVLSNVTPRPQLDEEDSGEADAAGEKINFLTPGTTPRGGGSSRAATAGARRPGGLVGGGPGPSSSKLLSAARGKIKAPRNDDVDPAPAFEEAVSAIPVECTYGNLSFLTPSQHQKFLLWIKEKPAFDDAGSVLFTTSADLVLQNKQWQSPTAGRSVALTRAEAQARERLRDFLRQAESNELERKHHEQLALDHECQAFLQDLVYQDEQAAKGHVVPVKKGPAPPAKPQPVKDVHVPDKRLSPKELAKMKNQLAHTFESQYRENNSGKPPSEAQVKAYVAKTLHDRGVEFEENEQERKEAIAKKKKQLVQGAQNAASSLGTTLGNNGEGGPQNRGINGAAAAHTESLLANQVEQLEETLARLGLKEEPNGEIRRDLTNSGGGGGLLNKKNLNGTSSDDDSFEALTEAQLQHNAMVAKHNEVANSTKHLDQLERRLVKKRVELEQQYRTRIHPLRRAILLRLYADLESVCLNLYGCGPVAQDHQMFLPEIQQLTTGKALSPDRASAAANNKDGTLQDLRRDQHLIFLQQEAERKRREANVNGSYNFFTLRQELYQRLLRGGSEVVDDLLFRRTWALCEDAFEELRENRTHYPMYVEPENEDDEEVDGRSNINNKSKFTSSYPVSGGRSMTPASMRNRTAGNNNAKSSYNKRGSGRSNGKNWDTVRMPHSYNSGTSSYAPDDPRFFVRKEGAHGSLEALEEKLVFDWIETKDLPPMLETFTRELIAQACGMEAVRRLRERSISEQASQFAEEALDFLAERPELLFRQQYQIVRVEGNYYTPAPHPQLPVVPSPAVVSSSPFDVDVGPTAPALLNVPGSLFMPVGTAATSGAAGQQFTQQLMEGQHQNGSGSTIVDAAEVVPGVAAAEKKPGELHSNLQGKAPSVGPEANKAGAPAAGSVASPGAAAAGDSNAEQLREFAQIQKLQEERQHELVEHNASNIAAENKPSAATALVNGHAGSEVHSPGRGQNDDITAMMEQQSSLLPGAAKAHLPHDLAAMAASAAAQHTGHKHVAAAREKNEGEDGVLGAADVAQHDAGAVLGKKKVLHHAAAEGEEEEKVIISGGEVDQDHEVPIIGMSDFLLGIDTPKGSKKTEEDSNAGTVVPSDASRTPKAGAAAALSGTRMKKVSVAAKAGGPGPGSAAAAPAGGPADSLAAFEAPATATVILKEQQDQGPAAIEGGGENVKSDGGSSIPKRQPRPRIKEKDGTSKPSKRLAAPAEDGKISATSEREREKTQGDASQEARKSKALPGRSSQAGEDEVGGDTIKTKRASVKKSAPTSTSPAGETSKTGTDTPADGTKSEEKKKKKRVSAPSARSAGEDRGGGASSTSGAEKMVESKENSTRKSGAGDRQVSSFLKSTRITVGKNEDELDSRKPSAAGATKGGDKEAPPDKSFLFSPPSSQDEQKPLGTTSVQKRADGTPEVRHTRASKIRESHIETKAYKPPATTSSKPAILPTRAVATSTSVSTQDSTKQADGASRSSKSSRVSLTAQLNTARKSVGLNKISGVVPSISGAFPDRRSLSGTNSSSQPGGSSDNNIDGDTARGDASQNKRVSRRDSETAFLRDNFTYSVDRTMLKGIEATAHAVYYQYNAKPPPDELVWKLREQIVDEHDDPANRPEVDSAETFPEPRKPATPPREEASTSEEEPAFNSELHNMIVGRLNN